MTETQGREASRGRLDALLDELGADPDARTEHLDPPRASGDPFFTARVLDSLPEPLYGTGASPLTRVATLLAFHVAAAVVGVIVYRWTAPRFFDQISDQISGQISGQAGSLAVRAEGGSAWAASGALALDLDATSPALTIAFVVVMVVLVGLVAFWATRSHTRAT